MMFSENRFPLFGIMLQRGHRARSHRIAPVRIEPLLQAGPAVDVIVLPGVELGGEARYHWRTEGFSCEIVFPA